MMTSMFFNSKKKQIPFTISAAACIVPSSEVMKLLLFFNTSAWIFLSVIFVAWSFSSIFSFINTKASEYECGFEPFDFSSRQPFNIHFYMVGILFVLFDVEIAILFPWAFDFWNLTQTAFSFGFFFVLLIILGLYFEWKKKAIDWSENPLPQKITKNGWWGRFWREMKDLIEFFSQKGEDGGYAPFPVFCGMYFDECANLIKAISDVIGDLAWLLSVGVVHLIKLKTEVNIEDVTGRFSFSSEMFDMLAFPHMEVVNETNLSYAYRLLKEGINVGAKHTWDLVNTFSYSQIPKVSLTEIDYTSGKFLFSGEMFDMLAYPELVVILKENLGFFYTLFIIPYAVSKFVYSAVYNDVNTILCYIEKTTKFFLFKMPYGQKTCDLICGLFEKIPFLKSNKCVEVTITTNENFFVLLNRHLYTETNCFLFDSNNYQSVFELDTTKLEFFLNQLDSHLYTEINCFLFDSNNYQSVFELDTTKFEFFLNQLDSHLYTEINCFLFDSNNYQSVFESDKTKLEFFLNQLDSHLYTEINCFSPDPQFIQKHTGDNLAQYNFFWNTFLVHFDNEMSWLPDRKEVQPSLRPGCFFLDERDSKDHKGVGNNASANNKL